MLTLSQPRSSLADCVRSRLERRWMPGDWFRLDDRVASHYAWKAAVFDAALAGDDEPEVVSLVEIGTRAGYSLQAFAMAASSRGRAISALCLDGYVDYDSKQTMAHFLTTNVVGPGIDSARLVVADTRHVRAITPAFFAHVDGDHTTAGVIRDLDLVSTCRTILVDDLDNQAVMAGVLSWMDVAPSRRLQILEDGLRTLGVISRKGEA